MREGIAREGPPPGAVAVAQRKSRFDILPRGKIEARGNCNAVTFPAHRSTRAAVVYIDWTVYRLYCISYQLAALAKLWPSARIQSPNRPKSTRYHAFRLSAHVQETGSTPAGHSAAQRGLSRVQAKVGTRGDAEDCSDPTWTRRNGAARIGMVQQNIPCSSRRTGTNVLEPTEPMSGRRILVLRTRDVSVQKRRG